jgi:multicomponent Na+:H+ antiporter subunit E
MRRLATTFLLVFAAWMVLTFSLHPENVLVGIVISLNITFICRHLLSRDTPRIILHPVKWFWLLVYLVMMLYVEVLAHLDVASRVFTGRVRPAIVEVPVEFGSLLGKTLFGNSITITPGTLTVNTGDEERFYIHTLAYRKDRKIGRLFNRFGLRVIT